MKKVTPLIILTLIVALIVRIDTIMVQINGPLVAKDFYHVTVANVGIISIMLALAALFIRYLVATKVHALSAQKAIEIGVGVLLISLILDYIARNFYTFLFANIVSGLGSTLVLCLTVSVITLVSNKGETEGNLSLYSVSLSIGLVVGPLLGESIVRSYGLRSVYLFIAGVTCIALAIAIFNYLPYKEKVAKESAFRNKDSCISLNQSIYLLAHNKLFLNTFIATLAFELSFVIITSYGGVYAEEKFGLKPASVELVFLMLFGISLVLRIILTAYAKSGRVIPRDSWFNLGLLLNFVSFSIIGLSHHISLFLVGVALFAIPHAILVPLSYIRVAHVIDKSRLILANTILQSAFDLGEAIGPMFAMVLIPYIHLRGIWLIMGIMPLLTFWKLGSELKRKGTSYV